MNTEEKITQLEIQLTHQENIIIDLNDVILAQQKTIDDLQSRLQKIESEVKKGSLQIKDISEEEPPPHY